MDAEGGICLLGLPKADETKAKWQSWTEQKAEADGASLLAKKSEAGSGR